MKAQSLWAGNEYAYIAYRGRGQTYNYQIQRVKVVKVEEVRQYNNKNVSTYATVEFMDWDGNSTEKENQQVRARDIVDFWDDWWNDISSGEETNGERLLKQKVYVEEQEKRREQERLEWKRKQEAQEAEEAEKREQIQIKRNKIRNKLLSVGLDPDSGITIGYDGRYVTINDPELTRWVEEEVRVIDI